jgi:predicted nucleic acid-binding protein
LPNQPGGDILVADLVLAEVLQGARSEEAARDMADSLSSFEQVRVGGDALATKAAQNFRHLRTLGVTPRKTIDTLLATWCMHHGAALLTRDRDFLPFSRHLGLVLI